MKLDLSFKVKQMCDQFAKGCSTFLVLGLILTLTVSFY